MFTINEYVNQYEENEKERALVAHVLRLQNQLEAVKEGLQDLSLPSYISIECDIESIPFRSNTSDIAGKLQNVFDNLISANAKHRIDRQNFDKELDNIIDMLD